MKSSILEDSELKKRIRSEVYLLEAGKGLASLFVKSLKENGGVIDTEEFGFEEYQPNEVAVIVNYLAERLKLEVDADRNVIEVLAESLSLFASSRNL